MAKKIRGFYNLSDHFNLSISEISCGHLREPFLSGEREITGYCSILGESCTYEIPFEHCQAREEYFQSQEYQKGISKRKSKLTSKIGLSADELTEKLESQRPKEKIIKNLDETPQKSNVIPFPTPSEREKLQRIDLSKKVPQITKIDIEKRFNRNR